MVHGQLIISEIMYNPPESGADSLEYIEIYNTLDTEVQLNGYIVSDNSADTLSTDQIIAAQGYAILATNRTAFLSVYNVDENKVYDANNLALSNQGETIYLRNPQGNVIDSVDYGRDRPWPNFDDGTNGAGASIELCNLSEDNNTAGNWTVANNDLGIMINDRAIKGTPGAANTVECQNRADYVVAVSSNVFTPAVLTIKVGETVKWENQGGFHNVNGSQDVYPDNPESFTSGSPSSSAWVYEYTFNTVGEYDYQCDPHVGFGMVGKIIVESGITELPLTAIADANDVDANTGRALSFGDTVRVQGVIHGENLRPSGHQYALVDVSAEEGIGIYSEDQLGYNYAEGDEIEVVGVVGQFNGLTQINPFEIAFMSSGNNLMNPLVVSELNESSESVLVTVENLEYVDESQWKGDGSSFNVELTNGEDEFLMRIDRDSKLANESAPQGPFNLTGIGGQYDNSEPYFDGYQLFPRSLADFMPVGSNNDLEADGYIGIQPNPAEDYFMIDTDIEIESISIINQLGQLMHQQNFQHTINIAKLNTGLYMIILKSGNKWATKRIFVK